jgi:hypothetical protein
MGLHRHLQSADTAWGKLPRHYWPSSHRPTFAGAAHRCCQSRQRDAQPASRTTTRSCPSFPTSHISPSCILAFLSERLQNNMFPRLNNQHGSFILPVPWFELEGDLIDSDRYLPDSLPDRPSIQDLNSVDNQMSVRWCNGNTAPFGGVIHGSNPCRTANSPQKKGQNRVLSRTSASVLMKSCRSTSVLKK